MQNPSRRRPTTHEDSVWGDDHGQYCLCTKCRQPRCERPDPYRRVLSSDDQYWSGYFDGTNCQSRIDLWVFWGVSLLMFVCGLVVGLRWHGMEW